MRALASIGLFLLTVIGMSLGIVAGTVALVSLFTETAARAAASAGDRFARRYRIVPFTSGLRDELAAVLSAHATTKGDR